MPLAFPVLQMSGDSIACYRDETAFRRAIALSTDKAINAGFFEKATLVDTNLLEHRFLEVRLEGRAKFFGWMRQARQIAALEVVPEGRLSLPQLKRRLTAAINGSSLWNENEDLHSLVREIEAAESFAALTAMFG